VILHHLIDWYQSCFSFPHRSKERAVVQLTESAANALRAAIAGAGTAVEGLRIAVEAGGCAGFQYSMGLISQIEPGDLIFERDGLKVFVDPASAPLLRGTTIDYVVSLQGTGFTFDNPQAQSHCSCGKSFA
jgi:iron-sulfur cluster assembly protein